MSLSSWFDGDPNSSLDVLCEDGDRILCRRLLHPSQGNHSSTLAVLVATEHPTCSTVNRLTHEYELRDDLDGAWAVRPLELVRDGRRTMLVLEDRGGEPLERLLGQPMEVGRFLRVALAVTAVLGRLHERGLVHKDVKPANLLINSAGEVRLTGFGIASPLLRERQAPEPPEIIAGTLAYMAPEQTGRMNRSIDARSDLYSMGITFYEMLTGTLPFTASDPMGWVHCHIARRAIPPAERADVPQQVSAIIMKLLVKTAEDRYQTAAGVAADLRRCLTEWETDRRVENFVLGEHDTPDRLLIPEKLYGREHQVDTLLAAFDRIVQGTPPELLLVSGYSGIGKSSVVNELHKVLVPPRGLFASGKFDQFKRDIPYSTLAQAFQNLTRRLLAKSDADLAPWRDGLREALGANGRLITDLVPELTLIIGEQPPVSELPAQDAQRRFQLVFRRFISVFARPEHPLALFLDDLQWLDAATLDLLEDLLTRADLRHLLLIGAYRDNEVTPAHPLMRKLDVIKSAGGKVAEITLAPLGRGHLGQLIADALRCNSGHAAPLAQLVHDKTGGNPFFAIQFMSSLAEERMLAFDHEAARWVWDLDRIHAERYTDNVADLVIAKLTRVPRETQKALQLLACLGNFADITTLSIVLGTSTEEVHAVLWPAVRHELVERLAGAYRFLHDRVREAAYSTIPTNSRARTHLRIGRLLVSQIPPERRRESIFEIVNQLNRGTDFIASRDEREQVAELNLLAGLRARASTANGSALTYLNAGAALLPENCWERRHQLAFSIEINRAECEFLTGALAQAEQRLTALSARAADTIERASVACLRVDLYITLGQAGHAIAAGLDYLRGLGTDWSPDLTEREARHEYEQIWSTLGDRPIEALVELPLMSDRASLATLDVLTKLQVPNLHADANLLSLIICRAVNLSLEGGNCDGSCVAYAMLGMIAGPYFGDYEAGFQFGRVGHELVEKRGLHRFRARTEMVFGSLVIPWTKHVRIGRDFVRRAFETANRMGDLTFAAYSCNHLNTNLLAAGEALGDVQREAEAGLEFAKRAQFGLIVDIITTQLQLIRTLRGLTPKFGSYDDGQFDEVRFERHLASDPRLALLACWYWIRKLQACFFAADYAGAVNAELKAKQLLWTSPSHLEAAEHSFYGALAHAASWESAPAEQKQQHFTALVSYHKQLDLWAQNCRENFENRAALVSAEIARIEGHELDAERSYERAIRSARANGFVHDEALACELAARFYTTRGFEEIGTLYLRKARNCYLRWGADAKVRQLDETYPEIREEERASPPTSTIGASVEHLDLATVIKVSQAVSGEIVLERMLDTLMRTAIEHAGAARGLLMLAQPGDWRIAAEATTAGDAVIVQMRDETVAGTTLPQAVFHYVLHTQESVILDDATAQSPFASDSYIQQHRPRSVLCLPLLNQGKLIGVLYLENNLAPRVFVPARIAVLKLLASEAAISLENTRLYRDLAEREARIRRLVDANIIGIFIWDLPGRILEANDAFLRMVGYDRADLLSGRLSWTDLTPPEWLDRDQQQLVPKLKMTGSLQPFEKEYFRKDGSRVPVLIGVAAFEEDGSQGVAFVLDLTERKRSEAEARESERRYREVQMELAHANRVATMGQLSTSIAHEINQPITGVVINAQTGMRWLSAEPPNVDGVREVLGRIMRDANRAADVIARTRNLIKKAPPRKGPLDITEAIQEVIALTRAEAIKHRVSVRLDLASDLPILLADRVQLQQVILNLIVNAIEAMQGVDDRPRELLISAATAPSDGVLVTVRDSGHGVRPADLERIFDAFYSTKPGGLGVGLSICRAIIETHGGRLWVTAGSPEGTAFQFTLPATMVVA